MLRQFLSERRISECLKTCYDLDVTALLPLHLGADRDASVYKAQASNQRSYFIKLKRTYQTDVGVAILGLLHDAGIQQIISPLKTFQGQLVQSIDGFTLIVYPFIENQNGFNQELTSNQWYTLGKLLRKVHALKLPPAIQVQIKTETYSPQWRVVVRSFYERITAKPSGDEVAKELLVFMQKHEKEIHRLVDTAELLSHKLHQQSVEFVLCHADIHGGNVLIDPKGSIYVVDWDAPVMAAKERDLMFIGGGVANVWNKPHEEEWFYSGYGETEINRSILAYYRHERIVEDIAEYCQALLLCEEGGHSRPEMYRHFIAMFEPRGVVDIAFETADALAILA